MNIIFKVLLFRRTLFFVKGNIVMRFLSIDLEACNKYVKGSVFSVGVVLADEQFNIIYKEDILINPHCKFNTNFRKPIKFSVTPEDVKNAPDLSAVYPKLSALFTADTIIMAHSANNDMFMLNEACRRAKLPPFKFEYICTQMIYSAVYDVMTGIGLDKAVEDLNLTFNHHKADDDAEMALAILQKCCHTMQKTYPELEKILGIKRGLIHDYTYEPMQCHELDVLRKMHKTELKNHTQELKKEIKTTNGISVVVDARTFEMIKQGTGEYTFCSYDNKSKRIKANDSIYLLKYSAHKDVIKTQVVSVAHYNSLLSLYQNIDRNKIGAKAESELEFLMRAYSSVDESKTNNRGICLLNVVKE